MAWSTIVEYSQQEGFYSSTSNTQLGGPVIRKFQLPPPGVPHVWNDATAVAEGGIIGEKLLRILPKVATFTSLLGSFTCRKFTTWDRRLYFPSEGRRAADFFARKIRRLRPGLNPQTRVPKASTLTSRPPKPLVIIIIIIIIITVNEVFLLSFSDLFVSSDC